MSNKKTNQVSRIDSIRDEIHQDTQLKDATLRSIDKLNTSRLSENQENELRIKAARGDPKAKSELEQARALDTQIEEAAALVKAIDDGLPVLEKKLESATKDQHREDRLALAQQQVPRAKAIETLCKKLAPLMRDWKKEDLEISTLTRKLGESVGLSPQRKLYETICQHFWPILGKHLNRPSLSGDLVSWSSRFAPSDSQAKDETKLR